MKKRSGIGSLGGMSASCKEEGQYRLRRQVFSIRTLGIPIDGSSSSRRRVSILVSTYSPGFAARREHIFDFLCIRLQVQY